MAKMEIIELLIDGKRKQVSMDLLPVVTSVDITSKALRVGDPVYLIRYIDNNRCTIA